jgi:nucleoside-diphosphate-sugar epimerase
VHVEDVVDAVMRFFHHDNTADCVYELAGPAGLPYNDFLDVTIAAAGGGVKRRNIPKKWADRMILLKGLFTDVTEDRRASAYFNLHTRTTSRTRSTSWAGSRATTRTGSRRSRKATGGAPSSPPPRADSSCMPL